MVRYKLVFLLLLLIATSAGARDYRRSRRDPSSASPPPVDYQAIRAKAMKEVRPRIEAWLLARTGILATCDRCDGAGLLPRTIRACPSCPGAGGVVRHPDFDPQALDGFHERGLGERWTSLDEQPLSLRGIAICSSTVDEIRILGSSQVLAFVRTRHFGESGVDRHPDVSLWIRSGGKWRVRDPFAGPPSPLRWRGGRFPSGVLPEPRQEEGTRKSLSGMRHLLRSGVSSRKGRISLIVRAESPGAFRKAVFLVEGRVGGAIELERMRLPLREGKCGDVEQTERHLAGLLGDLLGGSLLPDPREFHLRQSGSAILATGFSPAQYLREVSVVIDAAGRPDSIRRSGPGGPSETSLRYVSRRGQWLLSGWTRQSDAGREECEVRWRRASRGWLPAKTTLRGEDGEVSFRFYTR